MIILGILTFSLGITAIGLCIVANEYRRMYLKAAWGWRIAQDGWKETIDYWRDDLVKLTPLITEKKETSTRNRRAANIGVAKRKALRDAMTAKLRSELA